MNKHTRKRVTLQDPLRKRVLAATKKAASDELLQQEINRNKKTEFIRNAVPADDQRKPVSPSKAVTKVAKSTAKVRPPERPQEAFSHIDDVVNGDLAQHHVEVGEEDALERYLRNQREHEQAMAKQAALSTPKALARSEAEARQRHETLAAELGVTPADSSCDAQEWDNMTDCLQHLSTLNPRELRQRQFRLADWMLAYQCRFRGGRNKCPEDAMCKIPWMCSRQRSLSGREARLRNGPLGGMSHDQYGHLIYACEVCLMLVAATQDYTWCCELLGKHTPDWSKL